MLNDDNEFNIYFLLTCLLTSSIFLVSLYIECEFFCTKSYYLIILVAPDKLSKEVVIVAKLNLAAS